MEKSFPVVSTESQQFAETRQFWRKVKGRGRRTNREENVETSQLENGLYVARQLFIFVREVKMLTKMSSTVTAHFLSNLGNVGYQHVLEGCVEDVPPVSVCYDESFITSTVGSRAMKMSWLTLG